MDPYARVVGRTVRWDESLFGFRTGHGDDSFDERDSAPFAPLAAVVDASFTWGEDFLRVWQVSDDCNFAFITYTCAAEHVGPELAIGERAELPVVDQPARRVDRHFAFRHVGGIRLPAAVDHLDPEQAEHEDRGDEQHRGDEHVFTRFEIHPRVRCCEEVRNWASMQSASVNAALNSARKKVPKNRSKV